MLNNCDNSMRLPTIAFIGGNAQQLIFELYDEQNRPYDLSYHECHFYLGPYNMRPAQNLLSKTGTILDSDYHNLFVVELDTPETKTLEGKYVYQISIVYDDKTVYEPGQGFCVIDRNINR